MISKEEINRRAEKQKELDNLPWIIFTYPITTFYYDGYKYCIDHPGRMVAQIVKERET